MDFICILLGCPFLLRTLFTLCIMFIFIGCLFMKCFSLFLDDMVRIFLESRGAKSESLEFKGYSKALIPFHPEDSNYQQALRCMPHEVRLFIYCVDQPMFYTYSEISRLVTQDNKELGNRFFNFLNNTKIKLLRFFFVFRFKNKLS